MIRGQEDPIRRDPLPWCVVEIRTDVTLSRFPTEWSALARADRLNRHYRGCHYTVDLAPREPMFRFTWLNGGICEGPGVDIPTALLRLQRHPEEFLYVEQLPYDMIEQVK